MNRSLIKIFVTAILISFTSHLYAEDPKGGATPFQEITTTLGEIIKVVESNPGKEHAEARRAKLREIINPRFDFEEMSKRSLGTHWQTRTPEERAEFVSVFADLLARTYLAKIELVKRDTVKVDKEDVDFPKALVKTTITYNGDQFPLDYKLINQNGTWRVYDVIVENIGLVSNYRNEFAGIIRKDTFTGLLKQLKDKAAKQQS